MTVPSPTDLVQPPSGPSQPDDDALVPASVMPYLNFDGAVHYLSDGNDIDSWCVQIPRGAVLGFDTESHTTFDGRQHGVALVQFCFERDEEFVSRRFLYFARFGLVDLSADPCPHQRNDAGAGDGSRRPGD